MKYYSVYYPILEDWFDSEEEFLESVAEIGKGEMYPVMDSVYLSKKRCEKESDYFIEFLLSKKEFEDFINDDHEEYEMVVHKLHKKK